MRDHASSKIAAKPGVPIVRALDRGIAILKAFTAERPRQTLSELAQASVLDIGTTRRLLHTLQLGGLVEHDARTGLYALGVGVLGLAAVVDKGRDLRETAAPFLSALAEETGATSFLWVHHDGLAVCIDRVRARAPHIDVSWFQVGARAAMNCGGGPRALLAHLPERERAHALSMPCDARTPASQTDPRALARDCESIRAQGYALAVDDFFIGIAGLGVPVHDRAGGLVGAISISGLTAHVAPGEGPPPALDALRRIAGEIGAQILPG